MWAVSIDQFLTSKTRRDPAFGEIGRCDFLGKLPNLRGLQTLLVVDLQPLDEQISPKPQVDFGRLRQLKVLDPPVVRFVDHGPGMAQDRFVGVDSQSPGPRGLPLIIIGS